MSYDSGPQPIVAGVPLRLKTPTGSGAVQLAAVTIQNLSPLTISVTVGPNVHTLPAYTADQYRLPQTGMPVQLLGTNTTGLDLTGITSNVDAIWFAPDEIPASGTYPASLNPDPLALGIAIAEILLAQGIPLVLKETVVYNFVTIAPGGNVSFDSSQFASFIVFAQSIFPDATQPFLEIEQADPNGDLTDAELHTQPNSPVRYAVSGTQTLIVNLSATPMQVSVLGSNRTADARVDARVFNALPDQWSAGPTTFTAGNVYPLTHLNSQQVMQGPCFLDFHITDTVCKGLLELVVPGPFGTQTAILTNPAELVAGAPGRFGILKNCSVPYAAWSASFVCTTSAAAPISVFAILTAGAL